MSTRTIEVKGTTWNYRVGKGGGVVAHSDDGQRRFAHAWDIKGSTPDVFERGQHKKTTDGMVRPGELRRWLDSDPNMETQHG